MIEKAGLNFKEKIIEIKEQTDMKKKRINELCQINNFIDINYEKLIEDESEKAKEQKLPLPFQNIEQNEIISNSNDNKGINLKEKDILVEDTKNEEKENKKFLEKKREKEKKEEKEEKNKKNEIDGKFKYFSTCYICKEKFFPQNIHKFYGNLCIKCGDYNYSLRTVKLDFS